MGLLLGASMISVVETAFFLVKFIFEVLVLYWRRVPCHLTQHQQQATLSRGFTLP
jgi:hypothetical protein